jgi:GDP-D-mannose 3',5'-epimerase
MAKSGDTTEIWGDGKQTRSFLYIGECAEGATLLLRSGFTGPGSDEMVTVSQLVEFVADLAGNGSRSRISTVLRVYAGAIPTTA